VEVIAEAHQDSTTDDPRWECVDLRAIAPVLRPVTLAEMREEKALEGFALLRQSRLSVVPVSAEEWRVICRMAEYDG
ncbi:MAG TPA: EVE domain-containing protein, partial [Paracoccaceae bacterium]|nr:EVE domain-containing protein [Paracoccaceae bacterium]